MSNTAHLFGQPEPEVVEPETALARPDYPAMVQRTKAALVETYDAKIKAVQAEAEALEVDSPDANEQAVALASRAKKVSKRLEDKRKELVGEPNGYVKAVNNLFKTFIGPLDDTERVLKGKIGQYQARLEMERRKAQAAAEKAAREAQARLDAEAKAANVEPVRVEVPTAPPPASVTRTEAGTSSIKKVWKFEVIDETEVPREYCEPSDKLIREAVKGGIRKIPGVRIYEENQVNLRV